MSNRLFIRDWKVIVDGLDVSNCDLEFKVLRTIKPEPNKASFTIWNLTQDTRAKFLKRNQPVPGGKTVAIPVSVEAGFVDNTAVIFSGELNQVGSKKEDTDWKTIIAGMDGGKEWRGSRIRANFSSGTPFGQMVKQCAQALGLGIGNVTDFEGNESIAALGTSCKHGFTLDGSASDCFNRILSSIGLTWSIQNRTIQILPIGQPLNQQAILLSPTTGLLDSPEAAIDSTISMGSPQQFAAGATPVQKKTKPKDPSILKIKALMIPGLFPGRKIALDSEEFSGGYYITECEYVGQSWGNDWTVNMVARIY